MPQSYRLAILFTGHMIDAPHRAHPRFPASAEPAASAAIHRALESLASALDPADIIGIAGGASGGDILFHEACHDLAITTSLYLALPIDEYIQASVAPAGPGWVRRFHALTARLGFAIQFLDDSIGVPNLDIWARTNLWMVSEAISLAPHRTLLALWDGKSGDGPGGTAHLVAAAPALGIDVPPIISTQPLVTPPYTSSF